VSLTHYVNTKLLLCQLVFNILSYIGIRTALLESDEHTCPTCHQNDVSPDALIANKFLRQVAFCTLFYTIVSLAFLLIEPI
jgi:hypothetical protein